MSLQASKPDPIGHLFDHLEPRYLDSYRPKNPGELNDFERCRLRSIRRRPEPMIALSKQAKPPFLSIYFIYAAPNNTTQFTGLTSYGKERQIGFRSIGVLNYSGNLKLSLDFP